MVAFKRFRVSSGLRCTALLLVSCCLLSGLPSVSSFQSSHLRYYHGSLWHGRNGRLARLASSSSSPSSAGSSSTASAPQVEAEPSHPASLDKAQKRELDASFTKIVLPALVQFGVEPLATMLDVACLGRVSAAALAGAGLGGSCLAYFSRPATDPLLRTTISKVAAARMDSAEGAAGEAREDASLSKSVSTSLLLACMVGVLQAVFFTACAPMVVTALGASSGTDFYLPALNYLRVRALGAPALVLWILTNGVYRGLGDTVTPLRCCLLLTLLNAALNPVFVFGLHMGAGGAALATVISQTVALSILLAKLTSRIRLTFDLEALQTSLKEYLSAAGYLFVQVVGKTLCYAFCMNQAARLGTVPAAAYHLCFQLMTTASQVNEAMNLALQSLMAKELGTKAKAEDGLSQMTRLRVWHLISRAFSTTALLGLVSGSFVFLLRKPLLNLLTNSPEVLAVALSALPFVLTQQVIKGFAFTSGGMILGGQDFRWPPISMWISNALCVSFLACPLTGEASIAKIFAALSLFMTSQVTLAWVRVLTGPGVWKQLRRRWAWSSGDRAPVDSLLPKMRPQGQ